LRVGRGFAWTLAVLWSTRATPLQVQ